MGSGFEGRHVTLDDIGLKLLELRFTQYFFGCNHVVLLISLSSQNLFETLVHQFFGDLIVGNVIKKIIGQSLDLRLVLLEENCCLDGVLDNLVVEIEWYLLNVDIDLALEVQEADMLRDGLGPARAAHLDSVGHQRAAM